MWIYAIYYLFWSTITSTSFGNPIKENSEPIWINPCGPPTEELFSFNNAEINLEDVYVRSVRKIRRQLKISRQQLMFYDFDTLLIEAQRGVEREQYIPNWIPDISSVLPVINDGIQQLSTYPNQLIDLHTNLQKFAIAFEQVLLDSTDIEKNTACLILLGYLRKLLCEVETTILLLGERIPESLPRSLMTPNERTALEYTDRIVRDNGIVLKYKEFLDGWITVYKIARHNLEKQELE